MAGIRSELANLIRRDHWFSDAWHFPGMARAAELIEKGEIVISPQEQGASVTDPSAGSFEYWNKRIRADVEAEVQREIDMLGEQDSYTFGLQRAIEIIAGA